MSIFRKIKNLFLLLLSSRAARLNLSLLAGSLLNCTYIAGNIASAVLYRSVWSATVTVYHLMLIIIRVYLLSARGVSERDEKNHRVCLRVGVLLLFLDLASAFMMIYTIRRGSFVRYSGVILIGFVAFAVYSLTSSIFAMKRHSDDNGKLHFAARSISLSTSLMSVFNLQYSVLSLLGADSVLMGRTIMLGGLVVFSVILTLSVRLIRRSRKGLLQ